MLNGCWPHGLSMWNWVRDAIIIRGLLCDYEPLDGTFWSTTADTAAVTTRAEYGDQWMRCRCPHPSIQLNQMLGHSTFRSFLLQGSDQLCSSLLVVLYFNKSKWWKADFANNTMFEMGAGPPTSWRFAELLHLHILVNISLQRALIINILK